MANHHPMDAQLPLEPLGSPSTRPASQGNDERSQIRAIVTGSLGNLVEWYDFYVYSAFSLYFASAFFPGSDPLVRQLDAALLFALGFIIRPVGGWMFGMIADRHGRSKALTLSVTMMCLGSMIIAVTPSYASIGIAAPIVLALARAIQGLSLGGEYGTSATYIAEQATPEKRGYYASFIYVTMIGGQLAALSLLLILQGPMLTNEQLSAWGWRIPFAIGGLLALVALHMRRNLQESSHFSASPPGPLHESPLRALRRYPREMLVAAGLTMGGTTAFYTFTTYCPKFLKLSVGLSDRASTAVSFGSLVFALLLQPLYGALSDRIGRKPLLIWFGVMGTLGTIPILTTLASTRTASGALLVLMASWVVLSGYTSINAVVKAELFPAEVRATGVGLAHSVTVSIFGGTTEALALWCKNIGHESWFYSYLTVVIALSLVIYLRMPETRHLPTFAQPGQGS